MRPFILALLIAILLPMQGMAQDVDFMKMMRSDINRRYHKSENKLRYRAMWNGYGASSSVRPLWYNEEFRQELGLTPEQHANLDFMYSKNGSMGHWYRTKAKTNPELATYLKEDERLQASLRKDDPYGEKLTEEDKQAIIANSEKGSAIYWTETQKDVENTLTPEQMQKVRESELALMSEIPILNPSMFESLGLTDEQKKEMATFKKELEPEFEKIVDELVDMEDALQELKFDLFEKVGVKFGNNGEPVDENGKPLQNNPEAMKKKMEALDAEFAKNEKIRDRSKQLNERARDFMTGFKFKMFNVLTDDQLAKMQRIIDNPTEYVKKIRDRMQKERAAREKENEWKPGIDSWRPGDPLPKEYLEQRKQRKSFPKSEPSGTKS